MTLPSKKWRNVSSGASHSIILQLALSLFLSVLSAFGILGFCKIRDYDQELTELRRIRREERLLKYGDSRDKFKRRARKVKGPK